MLPLELEQQLKLVIDRLITWCQQEYNASYFLLPRYLGILFQLIIDTYVNLNLWIETLNIFSISMRNIDFNVI